MLSASSKFRCLISKAPFTSIRNGSPLLATGRMNCGNSVRNNSSIKVAVVGSGNFGSVIARNIARNAQASNGEIDPEVKMWVYDEQVDGRSLVEIINEKHVNVKYLPDVDLTAGVVASPDLVDVARDADVLVFVVPHQFLKGTFS
jgi:glycerol-3-phosphate dehydrogenase